MFIAKDTAGPEFRKASGWIDSLVARVAAGLQGSRHSARAETLPYVVNALESKKVPYVLVAVPDCGYYVRANPAADRLNRDWPDNVVRGKLVVKEVPGTDRTEFVIKPAEGDLALGYVGADGEFELYNYPSQIEDIARRMVACWNFCQGLDVEFLEQATSRSDK